MKNFLFAILFSIIGGFTAIGGYNLWENKSNVIAIDYNDKIKLANYIFDTTDVIVPKGLNFIYTAKVTTPSVVVFERKRVNSSTKQLSLDANRRHHRRGMLASTSRCAGVHLSRYPAY